MPPQSVEGNGLVAPMEINACAPCNLFWFDKLENVGLTPKSVLELFQFIGKAGAARRTIASSFNCPRCTLPLALTHDLQRATRFTYWRCPNDGGQLITFNQFLREKNFIRTPAPAELAKLRSTVRQITCSQCGGPVDLSTESACPHCGPPIALIDPDGVAKALQELSSASAASSSSPEAMRAALSDAQINAIFDLQRMEDREWMLDRGNDLVAIGAAAIGDLIGALVAPR
jgi:predicted RNA-binding Zn-ribbon protein involved in translation (DUF1610 family)